MTLFQILKKIFIGIGIMLVLAILGGIQYFYFPFDKDSHKLTYNNWKNGAVEHILPAADHQQFLLKISFKDPLAQAPLLKIDNQIIKGKKNDPHGRFWEFRQRNLQNNTSYTLQVLKADKSVITDTWPLKTFPHPDSLPQKLTVLAYTCAGGNGERMFGKEVFIKMKEKHALLEKAMSFQPDLAIANGDHIYWDMESLKKSKLTTLMQIRRNSLYGNLDLTKSMLSPTNYESFTSICNAQIAQLYGCLMRSTPVYFLADDHDLFENDEALPHLVTLPPTEYMLDGATSTQKLYYPEFLADSNRPTNLAGTKNDLSQSFGTIRYGKLLEGLLYDCKRYTSLKGEEGTLIGRNAEQWIADRTAADSTTNWLFHIPSSPIAWTAGKWSEWYPDVFQEDGTIGIGKKEKYLWQKGWWSQHQRLLNSLSSQKRKPIVLQGDLHMVSYGSIRKSGNLDFSNNPIQVLGTGPLGSGQFAFPSAFRGTMPVIPANMEVEELIKPLEKNGFTIIELTPEKMTSSFYAWKPADGLAAIDDLEPIFVKEISQK